MSQHLRQEINEFNQLEKQTTNIKFIKSIRHEAKIIDYSLNYLSVYDSLPTIYLISAVNMLQKTELADLTRMKNTLTLVPKLTWIIVENKENKTDKLSRFLKSSDLDYVHLNHYIEYIELYTTIDYYLTLYNIGLSWIQRNISTLNNGIVHFIEIDNTYDIRIFEQVY